MEISSTLLALNYFYNENELENAEIYFICVVQEKFETDLIDEINENLNEKNLGKALLIGSSENETAFTVIVEDLDKGLYLVKRFLWEYGYLLTAKIVLVSPQIKVLKDFGENL